MYIGNSYIGVFTELSQVFLAMYDTGISSYTYTGSENIHIISNEISLTFPLTIYNEAFLNPSVNGYFEMYATPNGISILQHISDGSQPMAIFNWLDKSVEFFRDLDIPNFYDKFEIDAIGDELSGLVLNTYTKTEVEALISDINLVDYCTKTEIDSQLTDYTTISRLQGNYMTTLSITETLINNSATITFIVDNLHSKTGIDSTLRGYVTSTQIDASCYAKS